MGGYKLKTSIFHIAASGWGCLALLRLACPLKENTTAANHRLHFLYMESKGSKPPYGCIVKHMLLANEWNKWDNKRLSGPIPNNSRYTSSKGPVLNFSWWHANVAYFTVATLNKFYEFIVAWHWDPRLLILSEWRAKPLKCQQMICMYGIWRCF